MERLQNFIDGEYRDPLEGKYFEKLSPRTGSKIYDLPDSTEMDVVKAIQAASKAFEDWSETKAVDRARIMNRIADLIDRDAELLFVVHALLCLPLHGEVGLDPLATMGQPRRDDHEMLLGPERLHDGHAGLRARGPARIPHGREIGIARIEVSVGPVQRRVADLALGLGDRVVEQRRRVVAPSIGSTPGGRDNAVGHAGVAEQALKQVRSAARFRDRDRAEQRHDVGAQHFAWIVFVQFSDLGGLFGGLFVVVVVVLFVHRR